MKQLLLSIVALCATMSVYSQSVKSLRINGQDLQQKYVSISDIDSITYDVYSQLQTLWSQGNATPFSLSDIESVSFENNEVTYSYVENFIDSIDAVFTKDGYVALFGVQKTEGENISELYNRMITISKVDYETGAINETQNLAILVDSLNNPTVIAAGDYTYFISNLTENTFDCIIMSEDGSWEYKNIPYSYTPNDANSRKFVVRRANGDIASSPVPPFSLGDLTNSIGMGNALGTAITATTNGERVSAALGIVGSFAGIFNGEAGLLLSGLSDAAVKALGGSALALAGYLWDRNYKFILEHIGPWYIGIQSIEQTGRKSCTVKYSIDGIKSVKDGHPIVQLSVYHSDKNRHSGVQERIVQLGNAENGFYEYTIENLEVGYYKIYMSVIDDCHRAMNVRITTYPEILVRMFDIGLDRYEVQDNPSYSNGTVNFKMDVFLKGSEEGLGDDVQQFGYYTRYSNAIPDYKQVTYFSSIFESTPLTYELPIEREGFFEENKNYSTFEAKATGYYIGAYIVLKNGNIVTIDEQEIEGLVFCEKPTAITGDNVSVTSNSAVVKSKYGYCLFWNATCGIEYKNNYMTGTLIVFPNDEDEQEINLTELTPNTTYKYRAFYEVKGKKEYGEYKTFKTNDDSYLTCPDNNHPHWIDLGLPSGRKWKCCNEGASSPEEFGEYYTERSYVFQSQVQELIDYCSREWDGKGYYLIGPNGGKIYLPAAGWYYGTSYRTGDKWINREITPTGRYWLGDTNGIGSHFYFYIYPPGTTKPENGEGDDLGFGLYGRSNNSQGYMSVRCCK